jgi:phosphoribosylformylglycinamidine synthase II
MVSADKLFTKIPAPFDLFEIDLQSASIKDLQSISEKMGLALAVQEMTAIKQYFQKKKRHPTDIELQALGQAWSEHCCYKSSKVPLKQHIYGIEEEKIVAREDAGVIEFDAEHYYCAALESHNHPSAIEPYGGAATGVGGIVRDIVCMGAQPIAYIDPLFFGPLDTAYSALSKGVKHPIYLFKGVVDGIRDYGNRIGIPTLCGQVYFHKGYTGNCLVNVGCIGMMKKSELIHSRVKAPGNVYIYAGGKTGRDGIHGVTFASAELTDDSEESSRSAVQVGDPITKEPLIHATLECNRKGLLEGLKDFGGGGLSCVCGELAYEAGFGAEIHLDNVPLKEEGLHPWEIWISESQERMMLVVKPEHVDEVLHICQQWDVTAVPIGKVIKEQVTRVFYQSVKILDMDLAFLTGGPVYDCTLRPFILPQARKNRSDPHFSLPDLSSVLLKLMGSLNICSKEWVIRQYDHEVRANTIIKPLQGKVGLESHGDATVIKPLEESFQGLAVTADVNPQFMEQDTYWGACSAVDEVCRNLVAVGARPDALLDCLNFGNPEKPGRMGEFYEACRGLGDMARVLRLPFVSGNVSFYNESVRTAVPPTPQLVGIGIVPDVRMCVTSSLKEAGNPLFLVGRQTARELGGSEYYRAIGVEGGTVPRTDAHLLSTCMQGLLEAIHYQLVSSCHDVGEGGIGVCLSEMAIGGDRGCDVDLSILGDELRIDEKLFSESNTRWIVEVDRHQEEGFLKILKRHHVPSMPLGKITGKNLIIRDLNKPSVKLPINQLRETWNNVLWSFMG